MRGVADLVLQPAVVVGEQQVVHPAAAADQHLLAVDRVAAVVVLVDVVGDLADAEVDRAVVAGLAAAAVEPQLQPVEVGLAEVVGPPQARRAQPQGGDLGGRQAQLPLLAGRELDLVAIEADAVAERPARAAPGTAHRRG